MVQELDDRPGETSSPTGSNPSASRFSHGGAEPPFIPFDLEEREGDAATSGHCGYLSMPSTLENIAIPGGLVAMRTATMILAVRREDIVQWQKRFSLPAVANHLVLVAAKSNVVGEDKVERRSVMLRKLEGG